MGPQQTGSVTVENGLLSSRTDVSSPKRRRWWVWILALLALGGLVAAIRHRSRTGGTGTAAHAPTGPVATTTAIAKLGNMTVYLDAIGTVTPVYTDTITAQVTGVITEVHYREGQVVRKGDPLIELDSRPYAAQLEEARGTLEHDQQLLAQAQMDLMRYQDAWQRNGIARQQFEDQQKVVLQDKGTVQFDQGTVHYDEVQVAYCHIISPINGRVGLRLVDPGNLVTANATTALVVITQVQPITIVFTLAEDHLNEVLDQMRHGTRLSVEAWDRDNQKRIASGQLATVDNQIDTTTGTVKLRATFDNRDGALFPNQFVNTRLPVKTLHNQVLVPASAVQHNGETAFVYVIQNGQAKMTAVKTGASDSGMTVVQGLQAGDVVANSSFEKLQDGAKIMVSSVPIPSTAADTEAP
jgi:multidrug efflux system membrane fusion protein